MSHARFDACLAPMLVARAIAAALDEDLGLAGDITTNAIVACDERATAAIVAREAGTVAGLPLAQAAFRALDPDAEFEIYVNDGRRVGSGAAIAQVTGKARALLTAERVALNFLGRLSGIATQTSAYCDAVIGTRAGICCTRKTTPGLRVFEKYAVRAGGGVNHRFGLFDAVLIKDNHIAAAGSVAEAVRRARSRVGHLVRIEVEVDTLDQLDQALAERIEAVLLDNMDVATLGEAVRRVGGQAITEASGGVRLETVREIAETGVDLISVGALTHSVRTLDLGLDWQEPERPR